VSPQSQRSSAGHDLPSEHRALIVLRLLQSWARRNGLTLGVGILVFLWTFAGWGFAHARLGEGIENLEMPTLSGERAHLLGQAKANVFLFFKPGQEHSNATLKQIAACQKELGDKSVRWVGVVSDRFPKAEIEAAVQEAAITMPILIDVGDALYGKLGLALTPVVGITDSNHLLSAYLPFTQVNYAEIIKTQIRYVLGEIDAQQMKGILDPPTVTQGSDAEIARRRFKLAGKLFEGKNYEKALESAKKSIEKDSSVPAVHVLLGQILAAQSNFVGARSAFDQALKLDPGNTNALAGKKILPAN